MVFFAADPDQHNPNTSRHRYITDYLVHVIILLVFVPHIAAFNIDSACHPVPHSRPTVIRNTIAAMSEGDLAAIVESLVPIADPFSFSSDY